MENQSGATGSARSINTVNHPIHKLDDLGLLQLNPGTLKQVYL